MKTATFIREVKRPGEDGIDTFNLLWTIYEISDTYEGYSYILLSSGVSSTWSIPISSGLALTGTYRELHERYSNYHSNSSPSKFDWADPKHRRSYRNEYITAQIAFNGQIHDLQAKGYTVIHPEAGEEVE